MSDRYFVEEDELTIADSLDGLARMEAQVAIATLLQRFPRLRLAPGTEPQRKIVLGFRGLASLPVLVS